MSKLAFISRHTPTEEQVALAERKGYVLVHVGDRDAFSVQAREFKDYSGVVVVHPAAALRLLGECNVVGVFENENRAAEGQPPQFRAKALHLFAIDGSKQAAAGAAWEPMVLPRP